MSLPQYLVSSEDCLVLLAIRNTQTLREAARLLDCDPGGLLRKVQRIASKHDVLQKKNGKWSLTGKGTDLVGWTQEAIQAQKKVLLSESTLRIASTSWLSERLLIPATSTLMKRLGEDTEVQYFVPGKGLERALIESDCEFAVACHPPEDPLVAHRQVAKEVWVAAAAKNLLKGRPSFANFSTRPFIRHHGLNPDIILPDGLHKLASISADNLIGIRAALLGGLGWSYVPELLVKKEVEDGRLVSFEADLKMDRKICLWWLRSSTQARKRSALLEEWLRGAC